MDNRKQNRNENDAPRYECHEWDQPEVTAKCHCRHTTLQRKVKTLGKARITAPDVIAAAIEHLRHGREVELCNVRNEPCIRLYPVASKDCTKIYVASQSMTALSRCMTDKKPVVVRGRHGTPLKPKDVENLVARQAERHGERICATPDTVVACPRCGYEFRVGKQLKG